MTKMTHNNRYRVFQIFRCFALSETILIIKCEKFLHRHNTGTYLGKQFSWYLHPLIKKTTITVIIKGATVLYNTCKLVTCNLQQRCTGSWGGVHHCIGRHISWSQHLGQYIDQVLFECWASIRQVSVKYQSIIGWISVKCCSSIVWVSGKCRLSVS